MTYLSNGVIKKGTKVANPSLTNCTEGKLIVLSSSKYLSNIQGIERFRN